MPKSTTAKIVSANDLLDGDVIFLARDGGWTRAIEDAQVAHATDDADRLLAAAAADFAHAVAPYLVDVTIDAAGRPRPIHYRERIRLAGPTNRPDLGRQAEQPAVRREDRHVSL